MPLLRHSASMLSTIAVGALLSGPSLAQEQAPASPAGDMASPRKPLDLRPPDITELFTSEQLNRILSASFREDIEEVEVEGARDRTPIPNTPNVWPGIAAPFWALLNPTQSWRIVMPWPPDQTRHMRLARVNAVDSYLLEPAGMPSPHAQ